MVRGVKVPGEGVSVMVRGVKVPGEGVWRYMYLVRGCGGAW